MWLSSRGLSSKGLPTNERTPVSLALSFQELLVLPTHFPFRVFVLGRRKTQGKGRTLCSLDNSWRPGGPRSHLLPARYTRAATTRKEQRPLCSESFLTSFGQFQVLFAKT